MLRSSQLGSQPDHRVDGRRLLLGPDSQDVEIRHQADDLLQRLEITLRHSSFLFGDLPVYSDFALFGILGNLTFRRYNQLNAEQTALAAWTERMKEVRLISGLESDAAS